MSKTDNLDKEVASASEILAAIIKVQKTLDGKELIALSDKVGLHFYEVNSIIRCQSDNSYTEFYISDVESENNDVLKRVVSRGFDEFEQLLIEKGQFFRVHNQHIVNINYISKYTSNDGNFIHLKGRDNVVIPVARARRNDFLQFLKNKGIII